MHPTKVRGLSSSLRKVGRCKIPSHLHGVGNLPLLARIGSDIYAHKHPVPQLAVYNRNVHAIRYRNFMCFASDYRLTPRSIVSEFAISERRKLRASNITSLALHLQHMHDLNPCPSRSTSLPPAQQVRRSHVYCTTRERPATLTDIDSPAAEAPRLSKQAVNRST